MSAVQSFFIPGQLPGLNDLLAWAKRRGVEVGRQGKRWSSYAEQKQAWEEAIFVVIRNGKLSPCSGPVVVDYLWKESSRRRDPSNVAAGGRKFIEDALVRAGILRGDGWKFIVGFTDRFELDKERPGVLVTIRTLPLTEE